MSIERMANENVRLAAEKERLIYWLLRFVHPDDHDEDVLNGAALCLVDLGYAPNGARAKSMLTFGEPGLGVRGDKDAIAAALPSTPASIPPALRRSTELLRKETPMSYEHCDEHDQDATNGCASCEQEQIDDLTDSNCITMMMEQWGHLSDGYKKALGDRLRAIAETPVLNVRCQTCPLGELRLLDAMSDTVSIVCAFTKRETLPLSRAEARSRAPGFCPLPVTLRYV